MMPSDTGGSCTALGGSLGQTPILVRAARFFRLDNEGILQILTPYCHTASDHITPSPVLNQIKSNEGFAVHIIQRNKGLLRVAAIK